MDATTPETPRSGAARPVAARSVEGRPAPEGRWGIEHRPTGRWVAFGSEAQCRALAAHLTEAAAVLSRSAPPVAS